MARSIVILIAALSASGAWADAVVTDFDGITLNQVLMTVPLAYGTRWLFDNTRARRCAGMSVPKCVPRGSSIQEHHQ